MSWNFELDFSSVEGRGRALCLDKMQFWPDQLQLKTGKLEDKNVAVLLIEGLDNYC